MVKGDSPAARVFFLKLQSAISLLESMAHRDDLPEDVLADVIQTLLEVGRASKAVLAEAKSGPVPPIEEMN